MSATILTKTGVTLLFGIDSYIAALAGYIVQNDSQDQNCKMADAFDTQGSTVGVAFYDQMLDVKFTALLLSGTSLPAPGSTVSINSVLYAVLPGISQKEKNNGFTECELSLRRWVDNAIPHT